MKRANSANLMPNRKRAPRRGLATGLLLVTLVFLSGFLALGFNIARLRQLKSDLRLVCRSAALAGANELIDEGLLWGVPNITDDVYAARQAAAVYAQLNFVGGKPVMLDLNTANTPTGNIVIGAYEPVGPVGAPIVLPTDSAPCEMNTVRVSAQLSRNVSNRATLWFGSLLGVTTTDVVASAQATLDRRVCGFRPEPHVRVPVVPLVAEYATWMNQALTAAIPNENDCFSVDYQSGTVVAGSDGVPEVTLVLGGGSSFGATDGTSSTMLASCSALLLASTDTSSDPWWNRCQLGLSQGDLSGLGGQLLNLGGLCPVQLESTTPTELPYCLMEIVGQCRAWSLAEPGPYGANVTNFAAGRIVAVRPAVNSGQNAWEIVVQPATLVCSQAVASIYMTPNPWIAKLELTQ